MLEPFGADKQQDYQDKKNITNAVFFYNPFYPLLLVDCAYKYRMDGARQQKSVKSVDKQSKSKKP